jgi:hypothetical protein
MVNVCKPFETGGEEKIHKLYFTSCILNNIQFRLFIDLSLLIFTL